MIRETVIKGFHQFSAMQSSVRLVKDPYDLNEVLRLSNHLRDLVTPQDLEKLADELVRKPVAVKTIRERYRVKFPSIETLATFPRGSLGQAFSLHLTSNGISLESLRGPEVHDDLTYIAAHLSETHDLWHTITGFGISVADELGLAAFGAAQFPSQFNFMLLSGGLLNTALYEFGDRVNRMNAISRGWQMGQTAKLLFGVKWDRLWKQPLRELRERFKINIES